MFGSAAVERSHLVDSRVSAPADASELMEPNASDAEHFAPSVEAACSAVQNDDESASVVEGLKPETSTSVMDVAAAAAGDLDDEDETGVDEPPGTPASLPSLVSEPEDTCMPIKFLKVSSARSRGPTTLHLL